MKQKKEQYIETLECLFEDMLPKEIRDLNSRQLEAISVLMTSILDKEREGLEKFFDSISHTLKFIPNFLILAITHKYIDPPVAARITAKLSTKQSVSIAKGLPAGYVGETAVYMENEAAAILLFSLPKKNTRAIMSAMFESHTLKVLDILTFADDEAFKFIKVPQKILSMENENLNDSRVRVLEKLKYK